MLSLTHRDAMWISDFVHSRQLAAGQVFSCEAVQHFQLELTRVSTALANKPGTAVMLISHDLAPNLAVSDVEVGGEDFVSSLPRKVYPNHLSFELDVERPRKTSKVMSDSWGSVQFAGDHKFESQHLFQLFFSFILSTSTCNVLQTESTSFRTSSLAPSFADLIHESTRLFARRIFFCCVDSSQPDKQVRINGKSIALWSRLLFCNFFKLPLPVRVFQGPRAVLSNSVIVNITIVT